MLCLIRERSAYWRGMGVAVQPEKTFGRSHRSEETVTRHEAVFSTGDDVSAQRTGYRGGPSAHCVCFDREQVFTGGQRREWKLEQVVGDCRFAPTDWEGRRLVEPNDVVDVDDSRGYRHRLLLLRYGVVHTHEGRDPP